MLPADRTMKQLALSSRQATDLFDNAINLLEVGLSWHTSTIDVASDSLAKVHYR
jgi:hypothetical protein